MSLIPERPLLFYPQVAATLGLEGAVMLQALQALIDLGITETENGKRWLRLPGAKLLELLPFWSEEDIHRIVLQLREQGVVLTETDFDASQYFRVAFDETVEDHVADSHASPPAPLTGSDYSEDTFVTEATTSGEYVKPAGVDANGVHSMSMRWTPEKDLLEQLAQYGVPRAFALEQVDEFVAYWSERNEARYHWGGKYLKHVLRQWRDQQTQQYQRSQKVAMAGNWQPSPDAMEILVERAGISANFVEDCVAEFILYWQDRGTVCSTWNSKFIQHVKRQWARLTHALNNDVDPRPIASDWRPDESVFDILAMANIDRQFAEGLLPEFVLYWLDDGQAMSSWNSKYLQYVKRQWAHHSGRDADSNSAIPHETRQRTARLGSTRNRDIAAELSDRSWAGG